MSENADQDGARDGPRDRSLSARLGFAELVAMVAATFTLNALAIDMMLPALGLIGRDLHAAGPNDRQLIITIYVIGNGAAQLFFGPLVDRFGRRAVLLASLGGYLVGSALSIVAQSFALLLAARAFQGVATAATRVALIAVVRDLTAGRKMAEVMSMAITVFMAAPILAPSFGQLVLFAAPWRGIFLVLMLYGAALSVWMWLRLPETQPIEARTPLNMRAIIAAYRAFVMNRIALGYTLASALAFGALFGYISASEQIFRDTFNLGTLFPLAFASVSAALACATITNARFVGRIGMRRLCHAALILFSASSLAHLLILAFVGDQLWVFIGFTAIAFFCLGFIGANASALAMEPMGHIAGAAAAANGFAGGTIAGLLGMVIGRAYDGTTAPIVTGFAILAALALVVTLITERGRLFRVGAAP
jgi:DHA1 family bicyclomycin/chloramphenicol resistance-like MFS transporter